MLAVGGFGNPSRGGAESIWPAQAVAGGPGNFTADMAASHGSALCAIRTTWNILQVDYLVMQVEQCYQPKYGACHELEWQEKLQTSGPWCDDDDSADEEEHT